MSRHSIIEFYFQENDIILRRDNNKNVMDYIQIKYLKIILNN